MTHDPILFVGGSGIVGRQAARYLRDAHPEAPLLIGGRDLGRASAVAAELRNAEGVAVDLSAPDLGLGDRPVSALALFFKDDAIACLRFAQARGIPYLSISSGVHEIGPEVAAYMHAPNASAVVLGAEWLVGATTVPAMLAAREFSTIDSVRISAIIDDEDVGGAATDADMERLTRTMPAALTVEDGDYLWRTGDGAQTSVIALDGTRMPADVFSPYDVLVLANETRARDVEFRLAVGESSSRRRGEPLSTEIIVDLSGTDLAGQPLQVRQAVVHPGGQMPLTGLGVAMVMERLAGLQNQAVGVGLYFPFQLVDPETYQRRLEAIGGSILPLQG
ncbi:hypothetical protein FIU89_15190 [Roseovarius sp. THAF27]|uniref:NAD(P)-dependent oxidoreductase n=1 Tax=Roseovarius sp. THAF27 TaxID=2587850 RepID=UPI0012688999|nr:NAD(P)-dependent oxidoreductase [Roseovarius sp. THAF27]QFT81968.1 hypothetical protein FIU89_15190 [Roseovarius sp. THAF27]